MQGPGGATRTVPPRPGPTQTQTMAHPFVLCTGRIDTTESLNFIAQRSVKAKSRAGSGLVSSRGVIVFRKTSARILFSAVGGTNLLSQQAHLCVLKKVTLYPSPGLT